MASIAEGLEARLLLAAVPEPSWVTPVGMAGDEVIATAATPNGGIVVVGETSGDLGRDVWVAKLDADGTPRWRTLIDGSDRDDATGLSVDSNGRIHIAGSTRSADLPAAINSYWGGDSDGFVARLDPDGELQWTAYLGSTSFDWLNGIAADGDGGAVVIGSPYLGSERPRNAGYVAAIGPDGTLEWHVYGIGGSTVRVDDHGDVFVAGKSLTKLNSVGEQVWQTSPSWSGDSYMGPSLRSLAFGDDGSIYAGGQSYSHNFEDSPRSLNGLLVKFGSDGEQLWQRRVEGESYDSITAVVMRPSGELRVVGTTESRTLKAAINSNPSPTPVAWPDKPPSFGFAAEVSDDGKLLWSAYLDGVGPVTDAALLADGEVVIVGSGRGDLTNRPLAMQLDLFSMTPPAPGPVLPEIRGTTRGDYIVVSPGWVHVDGVLTPAVTVEVNGLNSAPFIPSAPIEIHGLAGNDIITGTPDVAFPVILYGDEGDDTLSGGSGADLIYGGAGHDVISGGDGNDTLYGNFGSDTIMAGAGDDQVFGGIGRDVITGGAANDTLLGGNGTDDLRGGAGHDRLEGKGKPDTLYGGDGDDTIISGAGADLISGDEGDDLLNANPHALFRDQLRGGPGHDRYTADEDDLLEEVEEKVLA